MRGEKPIFGPLSKKQYRHGCASRRRIRKITLFRRQLARVLYPHHRPILGTLLGAIENLWEDAPPTENAYNLVVCPPKATTLMN